MKFSIVILHYQTIKDTENCIKSIQNHQEFLQGNVEIIIVDNGSPNRSGKVLEEKYSQTSHVHIILLEENLGFARGNNHGFMYAKDRWDTDFIILSNSDVTITQSDFFAKLETMYLHTNFALLGPDIRKPVNGEIDHQNPKMVNVTIDSDFLANEILKLKRMTTKSIVRSYMAMVPPLGFLKKKLARNKMCLLAPESIVDSKIMLYGAFLVFSKQYIEAFPKGLFDQTFMYGEEHAITYQIQSKKLLQLYTKELYVNHFEGSATLNNRTQLQRTKFLREQAVYSLMKISEYIEN